METELDKLEKFIITYINKEYYFVSDIVNVTNMQRSYIYKLIKGKKIYSFDKEGIKLIERRGFDEYYQGRRDSINKSILLRQIKDLDGKTLKEIEKIVNKNARS